MPIIFLLCTVGAFATASRLFDVYAMLAIGIGAFFLRRRGYQMAPFVLGLVLGPLLDKSLRRGLVLSDGSLVPFFTRPISLAFAVVTIFTILLYVPAFKAAVRARHRRRRRGVRARLLRPRTERRRRGMKLALCNEVLGALPLERAVRARGARSATTASRSRRSRSPTRPSASTPPRRGGSARVVEADRPRRHRPALAAGQAGGPVDHRRPTPRVRARTLEVVDAPDRPVRRARRQRARARLAEAARGRRRRNARDRARAALRDFLADARRGRRGARRRLLHRAAVAARDGADQHRRRGGRDRARDRPPGAAHDDRLQRRRRRPRSSRCPS